ncbi:MAG TPA: cbb3-type cytochrome c oxidase subunit I [Terriglobales bacterium]|nr:cbb3-type cytochrome c oxidase subunit I [Terriglobales bacterium]
MAGEARATTNRGASVTELHAAHGSSASSIVTEKPAGFLRRYLFSCDHKTIGLQYFFLALAAALVGIFLSLLMRIHIVWPTATIFGIGKITPESYLGLMTMHGTFMVFFVLTLAPQNAFGNYFLPLQIGAKRMAFPWLNMAAFWLALVSFLIMLAAFFVQGGAPISGWTHYAPLSAIASAGPGQGSGLDLWLVSIAVFCVASGIAAVNFIVTTIKLRAPGMTWMRLPLPCWAWFVTAFLILSAFSVLLAAAVMLFMDRHYGTSFFEPSGLMIAGQMIQHQGGSPLLWQHLFWFFGHPEVYIAILPGMGVTSHLLSTFARKPVFGYRAMVYATIAIGVLGFGIWGHHMFTSGMNPHAAFAFSNLTLAIGVPSAVKMFNWLGTLWGGRLRFTTPMLFSIGFVSLFITGGLTGPILAQPVLDSYLHDTYFVVAHFHLIMGMAAVFAIFAATYFWFPRIFNRMMSEKLGRTHFWLSFFGAYATFVPMHLLGMAGHPRRYSQLTEVNYVYKLAPLQMFISIAAFVTMSAQVLFLVNLFWSIFRGKASTQNPWEATTLEWEPLQEGNPVQHGAYEFGGDYNGKDFQPQSGLL